MPDQPQPPSLDERRLAIEERKAQQDYEIKTLELGLKRAESGWFTRLFTPLTTTAFAGILTLAASAVGTLMQGRSTLELERQKFQANQQIELQKEQHELILKMVSVGDEKQARANLKFLAESRLLDEDLAGRILSLKDVPVLPPVGTTTKPTSRAFQLVRTDDEALDLIIAWEGGFTAGDDPAGSQATNGGVTLSALSTYLGRTATIDELKNLQTSTMREIYKTLVATPAAGITVPLVRAAYYNIAVWSGTRRAITALQVAAGRVLGKDIAPDGIIGPASIALINAVPDPDLLVETADCVQLEFLKKTPAYATFSKGWIERARAFSPTTLHGVCPELKSPSSDAVASDTDAAPGNHGASGP